MAVLRSMLPLLLVLAMASLSTGMIYGRCQLAEELLRKYNFPRSKLADWICLVQHESTYNTAAKGGPNSDGSYDYGLFQINDHWWCGASGKNGCNIDCNLLLDDDISDDVVCAKKIYNEGKFERWFGWTDNCRGRDLSSYLQGCNVGGGRTEF